MAYSGTLPTYITQPEVLANFVQTQIGVNLGQELVNGYLLNYSTISVTPPANLAIGSGAFATSCSNASLTGADLATVQGQMNRFKLLKTP
jgi:hypothetical protein